MGCLDTWVLERAPPRHDCQPDDPDADCQILDPDQPHRWYLPPKGENTQGAGSGWDDRMASPHPSEAEVHKMRFKIPSGLNCTHCTLQWYWSTGNTCLYDAGYFSYFTKMAAAKWSASSWCSACMSGSDCSGTCCGPDSGKYAEEFWNCADIRVLAAGQQPPTLPPSPQTAPTPSGALQPTTVPDSCIQAWGKCGGDSWTGSTCCVPGHYCRVESIWYHQCVPGSPPTAGPATIAPTSSPPVTTPPAAPTVAPIVAPSSCAALCSQSQLATCTSASSDELLCKQSYIVRVGLAIPCVWNSCGCSADGENVLDCPGCVVEPPSEAEPEGESEEEEEEGKSSNEAQSGEMFLQASKASMKAVRKQPFLATALLQTATCLGSESYVDDESP